MYANDRIDKYLEDLAARRPAPGGGSAAALAGALGCSLISMVTNFTVGKEKKREDSERVKEILNASEELRGKLTKLVDEDVKAYEKFSSAYKLPKGSKERKDTLERRLKEALAVPLDVCRLSKNAASLCPELAEIANKNLISDVGCAVELLEGAWQAAKFTIEVNLKYIKDEDFIVEIRKVLEPMEREVASSKDAACRTVSEIMSA